MDFYFKLVSARVWRDKNGLIVGHMQFVDQYSLELKPVHSVAIQVKMDNHGRVLGARMAHSSHFEDEVEAQHAIPYDQNCPPYLISNGDYLISIVQEFMDKEVQ